MVERLARAQVSIDEARQIDSTPNVPNTSSSLLSFMYVLVVCPHTFQFVYLTSFNIDTLPTYVRSFDWLIGWLVIVVGIKG